MEKPNRPLVPVSPTATPLASAAIDDGFIQSRIFTIRGVQVMLSPDLADLYQVETRSFNQAVKRNAERFPPGFRFQLTGDELREVITNCDNPDRLRFSPQKPYAFTEQGVAMLSGVLKSEVAVRVSIRILETFVAMRRAIASIAPLLARIEATDRRQISDQARNDENQNRNEERFKLILDAMRDRTFPPQKVFFDGQVYDAFEQMKRFVRMAKARRRLAEPPRQAVLRLLVPGQVQHPGHPGEDMICPRLRAVCALRPPCRGGVRRKAPPIGMFCGRMPLNGAKRRRAPQRFGRAPRCVSTRGSPIRSPGLLRLFWNVEAAVNAEPEERASHRDRTGLGT